MQDLSYEAKQKLALKHIVRKQSPQSGEFKCRYLCGVGQLSDQAVVQFSFAKGLFHTDCLGIVHVLVPILQRCSRCIIL